MGKTFDLLKFLCMNTNLQAGNNREIIYNARHESSTVRIIEITSHKCHQSVSIDDYDGSLIKLAGYY